MLGIAERQNTFEFLQIHKKIERLKPFKNKANSLGDWIQFNRLAKNLTPGHLAAKMGIAAAVVRAWEGGISQPDEQCLSKLTDILGVPSILTDGEVLTLRTENRSDTGISC